MKPPVNGIAPEPSFSKIQSEVPFFQADVMRVLGIRHPNTLRQQIKAGGVPAPDVRITAKTRYWWRSSLVRAGLLEKVAPAIDHARGSVHSVGSNKP